MIHKHDIIVFGASAGGVEALIELVQALPADCQVHQHAATKNAGCLSGLHG